MHTSPSRTLSGPILSLAAGAALAALAAATPPAAAQEVTDTLRLNDTGLTRCTHNFRVFSTDCAGSGQDADSGRDVTNHRNSNGHAGFIFAKVCNSGEFAGHGSCSHAAVLGTGPDDWGCTADRVTGLVWEVKTADGGLRDGSRRYTNYGDGRDGDASTLVGAVNASGLCGATDWRLPTTHELQGIEDFDYASPLPSIDGTFFPNTLVGHYWNSEPFVGQASTVAWVTSFVMDPKNVSVTGEGRSTLNGVRLVRGATRPQAAGARFAAQGTDVHDLRSHLVWQRCSVGQTWDGTTCQGNPQGFEFGDAIAYAQAQATATGLPWRVPNAKELHSIVDHAHLKPAIDRKTFPNTKAVLYWTSTAYAWTATGAWAVQFNGGHVLAYYDGYQNALRLVRDE